MPIYEYQCRSCGRELEVMQHITDAPLDTCPSCGGRLQRLISNTSFILKGTGWYVTDYAGKSPNAEKKDKKETPGKVDSEKSTPSTTKEKKDD